MSDRRRTRTPSLNAPPAEPATTRRWTEVDVRALGVTTDVVTAAQILGLSRNTAYRLARAGTFPVPIIQAGHQYRIPVAGLLTALHLDPTPPAADGGDPHPPAP
ncbi:helix-turn-helix domain-containing protein [Micromonospora sp. NPDC005087]|uniref:helix-turn-helix domain-containing protein n=1 Tax=Micromonospora sp. NPDC005087 TaxID=3364225 RepID=UPI00367DCB27